MLGFHMCNPFDAFEMLMVLTLKEFCACAPPNLSMGLT